MPTLEQQIADKEKDIKTLEGLGETEAANKRKAELAKLKSQLTEKEEKPMAEENEGLVAPVTKDEYESAGGGWVTIPSGETSIDLDIEMGLPGWDTPGRSYKFPITVVEEGMNYGKETKISSGATAEGIWKTKEIVLAVTGEDMPMQKGQDGHLHPVLIPSDIGGKLAVGHWELKEGPKGGLKGAETVTYPKLVSILPPGSKNENLGI